MAVALLVLGIGSAGLVVAAPVAVREPESALQSYLVLRDGARNPITLGEYKQRPKAGAIEVHLTFRFKDGSLHEETAVFSQRGPLKLARYALQQRGPSFPTTLDASLDGLTGRYLVKHRKAGRDEDTERRPRSPASHRPRITSGCCGRTCRLSSRPTDRSTSAARRGESS